MGRKKELTIDRISSARVWLHSTERFPELLKADDVEARMAEVREAFNALIDFRNLVRFVAEMDEAPRDSAARYLEL